MRMVRLNLNPLKNKSIEILDRDSLMDYFLLTVIVGVGILLSILLFIVSVKLQYKNAVNVYKNTIKDHISSTQLHLRNIVLNFEVLSESLGDKAFHSLGFNYAWLEGRLGHSDFSCVMIVDLIPETVEIERRSILKPGPVCQNLTLVSSDLFSTSDVKVKGDVTLKLETYDGKFLFRITKKLIQGQRHLIAMLPIESFLAESEGSQVSAKITSVDGIKIASENFATKPYIDPYKSDEAKLFQKIQFLDRPVIIEYTPAKGQLPLHLGWSFAVLVFCLTVVALFSYIFYGLIERKLLISQEVKLKTDELRKETEKAQFANQTKSRFLANVSHEIRTPLNLILGMADVLSETSINAEQESYISAFKRAGNHLLDLINDILDIAKIETGEVEVSVADVDIVQLVESISEIVIPTCRSENLTFTYCIDVNLPRIIQSDSRRIQQILINLLNNAIKFTNRGMICLKVNRNGDRIEFEVRDTGMGIAKVEQARVFEEFYQADSTTKRQFSGVGLGLAIVKTCVRLLNGDVKLDSTVGQGTTITVSLPLKVKVETPWLEEFKSIIPKNLDGKNEIILISNSTMNVNFIKSCLSWLGYKVFSYENIRLALRKVADSKSSLRHIIFQINDPGTNISEFLLDIQKEGINEKKLTVLLSIARKENDIETLEKLGVKKVCYEPIRIGQLLGSIENHNFTPVHQNESKGNQIIPKSELPKGLKILIAEDDADNRFLIQTYLKTLSADITYVDNGQQAIDLIKSPENQYQLLITDIQMPIMDGIELIEKVREFEKVSDMKSMKIVALTADALSDQQDRIMSIGATSYLTKPISKANLINSIFELSEDSAPAELH